MIINTTEDPTMKDTITFDDFLKLDLRVGTVTKAEPIPKSKKLLRLEVFFGSEVGTRVILAGVAETFSPEMMLGNQVTAVLNLAPRTMMGMESHGMLLAGHSATGKLSLVCCPGVVDGGEVG